MLPKIIEFSEEPKEYIGIHAGMFGYKKETVVPLEFDEKTPYFRLRNTKYVQSGKKKYIRLDKGLFKFSDHESWVIYTKEGCPYCKNAKDMLHERVGKSKSSVKIIDGKIHVKEVEDEMKRVGREDFKTWPKIFLNGQFVGGFSDLQNKLKQLK